jgi:hypothetical protein
MWYECYPIEGKPNGIIFKFYNWRYMLQQLGKSFNLCNAMFLWNVNNKITASLKLCLTFGLMTGNNELAEFDLKCIIIVQTKYVCF